MSEYSGQHWSVGEFTLSHGQRKGQSGKNPTMGFNNTLTSVMLKTGERLECFAQYFHAQMAFNLQHF